MMITVHVLDAPRITLPPRDHKVTDNSAVSFFCKASGNPAPDVYWRKGGKRVTASRHRMVIPMPHGSVLRLESAKSKRDDSVVECVAENQLGDPATASASLSVYPEGLGMSYLL